MAHKSSIGAVRRAVLVLTCFALAAPAGASGLHRGVVLDQESGSVVIMRPEGGIAAIEIATGKERWRSGVADLPVFAHAARVGAIPDKASGILELFIYDARTGRVVDQQRRTLPAGVEAFVDARLEARFDVVPRPGEMAFEWRFVRQPVSGAMPSTRLAPTNGTGAPVQDRLDAPKIESTGIAFYDPKRRSLDTRADERAKAAPSAQVEGAWLKDVAGRQFISADGLYVLASEADGAERWRWTVYEITGRRLGGTISEYAYQPFGVLGEILLHVVPSRLTRTEGTVSERALALTGTNLATGVAAWSWTLRDTRYSGPWPP